MLLVRRVSFFLLFLFLAGAILFVVSFDDEPTAPLTGRQVDSNFGLSITLVGSPSLVINSPSNQTYFSNASLLLDVTSNADTLWYSLNQGTAFFFSGETLLNASSGTHLLSVFANNSDGITQKNITFTVNSSLLTVVYANYSRSYSGNSTNFNAYSFSEIQNLSDVIFEDVRYGKIQFKEPINLTNDASPSDGVVTLDSYITLISLVAGVDSAVLPNFDLAALVEFRNLSFSNPRILRDGSVCASPDCIVNSYSNAVLSFNVTGFSDYSVEETPASFSGSGGSSGSGSSGGGRGSTLDATSARLTVFPSQLAVSVKQGRFTSRDIVIENLGDSSLTVNLTISSIGDYVRASLQTLTLAPGEKRTVTIDFLAPERAPLGTLLGKLVISAPDRNYEVLMALDIVSLHSLFDVRLEISQRDLIISPGEELLGALSLINLGETGRIDARIVYELRESTGRLISSREETIAVETQASLIVRYPLPADLAYGSYILSATLYYGDVQQASASSWISVQEENLSVLIISIVFLTLAFIIFLVIFFLARGRKKSHRPRSRLKL